jgi:hypothetical protein
MRRPGALWLRHFAAARALIQSLQRSLDEPGLEGDFTNLCGNAVTRTNARSSNRIGTDWGITPTVALGTWMTTQQ